VFVGVDDPRQLVVRRQDLRQSRVVVHRVAGQAEQAGPQAVAALVQGLQEEGEEEEEGEGSNVELHLRKKRRRSI